MGRHLGSLKAELGAQARSAFQALAVLKQGVAQAPVVQGTNAPPPQAQAQDATGRDRPGRAVQPAAPRRESKAAPAPTETTSSTYTTWSFGELPELLEVRKGGQTLFGFPALIDRGTHVEIEVFDEPSVAAAQHRAGLRRLVSLAIKEPIKYLEKNIPDLQKMAVSYMPLGTQEELRDQIIGVALDRAFLAAPLPTDEASFKTRIDEGRARLNLIAQEIARLGAAVLADYALALRKLRDSKPSKEVADDVQAQLQRLVPKRFIALTPWAQLQHLPRYLKAVVLRLDKLRADPARDAQRLAELRPLEQRYTRKLAELRGVPDERLQEYRWLLEELRVSFYAQELRHDRSR